MVVFLIGGESRLMDGLINKFNKDGHRVYLLTGNRNVRTSYQKVFEKYNFKYDSDSIREIFASTNPDVVIFTGAQDTHYRWENARKEAVQFSTDLTNILSAYSSVKNGRFCICPRRMFLENLIQRMFRRLSPYRPIAFMHLL